ncbi:MAG: hypothetical protein EHM42_14755, partial [Planctomycetaceae bacterium]
MSDRSSFESPSSATAELSLSNSLRADAVCDAFEQGWKGGEAPRVESFLPLLIETGVPENLAIAELLSL